MRNDQLAGDPCSAYAAEIQKLEEEANHLYALLLDMRQHQGSIQQYVQRIDAALAGKITPSRMTSPTQTEYDDLIAALRASAYRAHSLLKWADGARPYLRQDIVELVSFIDAKILAAKKNLHSEL